MQILCLGVHQSTLYPELRSCWRSTVPGFSHSNNILLKADVFILVYLSLLQPVPLYCQTTWHYKNVY